MDDSQHNILGNLSNLEQQPPEELYTNIIGQLGMEAGKEEDAPLESLKDFPIAPPQELYGQIAKKAGFTTKGLIFYLNKYRAAAAIILGLVAFGIIYQSQNKKNSVNIIAVKKTIPPVNPDTTQADDSLDQGQFVNKSNTEPHKPAKLPVAKKTRPGTTEMLFLENDLITSFTDCENCNFATFFNSNKKTVIAIDPYSSVTVTGKMGAFMKTLYSTNRRNKPTSKAKKAKRTLLKWKKADAAHFDNTDHKSALDAIDLTEYLIDNK